MPSLYSFSRQLPKNRSNRLNLAIEARLSRLPFTRHPAFSWALKTEGYQNHTFGAKAGPSADFGNVCHEMAHAVEFGHQNFHVRVEFGAFVFKLPEVAFMGEIYHEPTTTQPTERECRTWGIQLHLMRAAGVKIDQQAYIDYCARVGFYLPDSCLMREGERKVKVADLINAAYDKTSTPEISDQMDAWLDLTLEGGHPPPPEGGDFHQQQRGRLLG